MGFFDFFKKKKEPNPDDIVSSIISQVFPKGKSQIQEELASTLYTDLRGKYPQESLMRSIAYCGSMLITAKDRSAQRVVDMGMLLKPGNKYTREDAIIIYKSVVKSYFSSKLGIDNQEAFDAFYKSLGNVGNSVEIENKRIKGAFGTYGFTLSNPIPIKGVEKSYTFLDSLLTSSGEPILYKRLGSYSSSVTKELIDGYAISTKNGCSLGTIYICGYCNVDNPDPPVGFILKGMPIAGSNTQVKISANPVDKTATNKCYSWTNSSFNAFGLNKEIPTMINPAKMDALLREINIYDLELEFNAIFERNHIDIKYDQIIYIRQLYRVFSDYIRKVKEKPLFTKEKESAIRYISENIKQYFKIGVAVYLVHTEYGEYIGK